jgi:hypothetical protein
MPIIAVGSATDDFSMPGVADHQDCRNAAAGTASLLT